MEASGTQGRFHLIYPDQPCIYEGFKGFERVPQAKSRNNKAQVTHLTTWHGSLWGFIQKPMKSSHTLLHPFLKLFLFAPLWVRSYSFPALFFCLFLFSQKGCCNWIHHSFPPLLKHWGLAFYSLFLPTLMVPKNLFFFLSFLIPSVKLLILDEH